MKRLSDVKLNEKVSIKNVYAKGLLRERMLALGFTKGAVVEAVRFGPHNSLIVYNVRNTMIALRTEEGNLIEV